MTLTDLQAVGFAAVAEWRLNQERKGECVGEVPHAPGLYLFVVGSEVRYVGAALGSLRRRMASYQRRQRDGSSTRPVHEALGAAVRQGEAVHIYTLEVDAGATTEWQGLPVNLILGVEGALIARLDPEWNRRGRAKVLDSDVVTAADDDED